MSLKKRHPLHLFPRGTGLERAFALDSLSSIFICPGGVRVGGGKQWSTTDDSEGDGWMGLAEFKEKGPVLAKILIAREWGWG